MIELEVADNIYLMVQEFERRAGVQPITMRNNIRIQANIPDDKIESRY